MRRESSTVVVLVGEVDDQLLGGLAQSGNVSVARVPDAQAMPAGVPREVGAAGQAGAAWAAGAAAMREAAKLRSTYVVVADDPIAEVAASWQAMWDLSGGPDAAAEFERHAREVLAAWRTKQFELPDYYLVAAKVTSQAVAPGFYLGPLRSVRPRRVALAVTEPMAQGAIAPGGMAPGGIVADAVSGGGPAGSRPVGSRPAGSRPAGSRPSEGGPAGTGPAGSRSAWSGLAGGRLTGSGDQVLRVVDALRALEHGPWWPPLDELLDVARRFYPGALTERQLGAT